MTEAIKLFEFKNDEVWAGNNLLHTAQAATQSTGFDYLRDLAWAREITPAEMEDTFVWVEGESYGEQDERMTYASLLAALVCQDVTFPRLFSAPAWREMEDANVE